jgi:hypothetical protein
VLYGYGLASLLTLGLCVYCALNVITTPEHAVRNLPKLLWLALVIFFPVIGGVAWLVAGRPQGPARSLPYKGNTGAGARVPAEYDRPGRATAASPDDDAAFLRSLRERAEAQRAEAAAQRREALEAEERRRAAERAARRDDSPA